MLAFFALCGSRHSSGDEDTGANHNNAEGACVCVCGAAEDEECLCPPLTREAVLQRLLGPAFATPLLGVAALAVAGETDATALVTAYAGLCGMGLHWLLDAHAAKACGCFAAHEEEGDEARAWTTRLNAWLCLVPFLVRAAVRLQHTTETCSSWATGALVVCVVWCVLYF